MAREVRVLRDLETGSVRSVGQMSSLLRQSASNVTRLDHPRLRPVSSMMVVVNPGTVVVKVSESIRRLSWVAGVGALVAVVAQFVVRGSEAEARLEDL